MPETLPTAHSVGDTGHTTDHNTFVTAITDIDSRLSAVEYVVVNAKVASYTLVLTDAGKSVDVTSASLTNVTVPPNSSVAFPVGTVINVAGLGAGAVIIAAGGGVTLRSRAGALSLAAQYSQCSLRKLATDTWILSGDLA